MSDNQLVQQIISDRQKYLMSPEGVAESEAIAIRAFQWATHGATPAELAAAGMTDVAKAKADMDNREIELRKMALMERSFTEIDKVRLGLEKNADKRADTLASAQISNMQNQSLQGWAGLGLQREQVQLGKDTLAFQKENAKVQHDQFLDEMVLRTNQLNAETAKMYFSAKAQGASVEDKVKVLNSLSEVLARFNDPKNPNQLADTALQNPGVAMTKTMFDAFANSIGQDMGLTSDNVKLNVWGSLSESARSLVGAGTYGFRMGPVYSFTPTNPADQAKVDAIYAKQAQSQPAVSATPPAGDTILSPKTGTPKPSAPKPKDVVKQKYGL